jgi:hypothetical protein
VRPQARREYLARMRERYETAARASQSRLLDEACAVTGHHRKAVIRMLRRPTTSSRGSTANAAVSLIEPKPHSKAAVRNWIVPLD